MGAHIILYRQGTAETVYPVQSESVPQHIATILASFLPEFSKRERFRTVGVCSRNALTFALAFS
jgi:hypothetical protein